VRILITGGAGFIGANIAAAALAAGHDVRVLDARLPLAHPTPVRLPDGVEDLLGDVRDAAAVERALDGVDAVCHQAAMVGRGRHVADAPEYASCNDVGTAVLLRAMTERHLRHLVLAGSVVVYGEGRGTCARHGEVACRPRRAEAVAAGRYDPTCPHCDAPVAFRVVDEDSPPEPRNVYGATKLAQEHITRAWAEQTGSRAVTLRYHQVYGPGMNRQSSYSGVTCAFRSVVADGGTIEVYEDGRMRRDFIHVRDIAAANLAALEAIAGDPAAGYRAYNVATGRPCTVLEFATLMADIAGAPQPKLTGSCRFDDVRHIVASPARLQAEFGWRARVDKRAGLTEFVAEPMRG
jgi:dTDP-L-rhamnose 4-epimerase